MRGAPSGHGGRQFGRSAAVVVVAAAMAFGLSAAPPVAAQTIPGADMSGLVMPQIPADERMLVESDQLVYDYDNDTVAAVGNVRIYYAGFTLEAAQVTYNQRTGRLIASGNVKLVEPSGTEFRAEHFDITDDFRDGFVRSLNVETPDRTRFTAQSAERSGGETTTFNESTYTACEPCKSNPGKPLLWNVKAKKIVVNHREQMIYFTDARIEFFGMPLAYLPYFAVPDPSVTRKSGWLSPGFGYEQRLGAFLSAPYYWAPAPNYDVTFTPTVLTRQGLLTDVEFRHRVEYGSYTLRGAGIYQLDPQAFAGTAGERDLRGGLRTTGEFYINRDWTFGWDGTLTTDRAFTRQYKVLNNDTSETVSTVHLTGIGERNYFEARASHFQVLTDRSAAPPGDPGLYDQGRQAWVAPVIDYRKIADHDVLGGELSYTTNFANVVRAEDDPFMVGGGTFFHGTQGTTVRATQEIAWKGRYVTPMGQVITPFASVRGDAFYLADQSPDAIAHNELTGEPAAYRFTPAIGVEWTWPFLIRAPGSTHIIEPIAQIIARPDVIGGGNLPNNDAQSLVFDISNVFEWDKFSGYDRVETGTRANYGARYFAAFDNGASMDAAIGQSVNLAGANPFDPDAVSNVGAGSGLDSTFSDYVAGISVDTGLGPRFSARGRFDESTFALNRAELQATAAVGAVTASANYIYSVGEPATSAIRAAASVNFAENWRAFGSITYDVAKAAVAGDSFGIAFDNECLTISIAYSEIREGYTDLEASRWINFRLQMRTLGETSYSSNLSRTSF